MLRLERKKSENKGIITLPADHAGCRRSRECVLSRLIEAKFRAEDGIEDAQKRIINAGDDRARADGFFALKTEGRRREAIMKAMAEIKERGSCSGVEYIMDDFDKKIQRENRTRQILKEHLLLEKSSAEAMIDECIEEKRKHTNFDAILENYGFQMAEERRLGRINRALEQLDRGNCEIRLEGLMAAHKIEHVEKLVEQAYA